MTSKPSGPTNKRRGSSFERNFAKMLSNWLSYWGEDGTQDDGWFVRGATSGARATVSSKQGKIRKAEAGDIVSIDPRGAFFTERWYIELKHYNSLEIDKLIYTGLGKLSKIYQDNLKEAKKYDKDLLLVFKEKNKPIMLMTRPGGFEKLVIEDNIGGGGEYYPNQFRITGAIPQGEGISPIGWEINAWHNVSDCIPQEKDLRKYEPRAMDIQRVCMKDAKPIPKGGIKDGW